MRRDLLMPKLGLTMTEGLVAELDGRRGRDVPDRRRAHRRDREGGERGSLAEEDGVLLHTLVRPPATRCRWAHRSPGGRRTGRRCPRVGRCGGGRPGACAIRTCCGTGARGAGARPADRCDPRRAHRVDPACGAGWRDCTDSISLCPPDPARAVASRPTTCWPRMRGSPGSPPWATAPCRARRRPGLRHLFVVSTGARVRTLARPAAAQLPHRGADRLAHRPPHGSRPSSRPCRNSTCRLTSTCGGCSPCARSSTTAGRRA